MRRFCRCPLTGRQAGNAQGFRCGNLHPICRNCRERISCYLAGHFHRSWIVCSPGGRNDNCPPACFANHKVLATAFCWIREALRARRLCAPRTIHLNTIRVGGIDWVARLAPLVKPRHLHRRTSSALPSHCNSSARARPRIGKLLRCCDRLNSATNPQVSF